jgi:hypothetical protein
MKKFMLMLAAAAMLFTFATQAQAECYGRDCYGGGQQRQPHYGERDRDNTGAYVAGGAIGILLLLSVLSDGQKHEISFDRKGTPMFQIGDRFFHLKDPPLKDSPFEINTRTKYKVRRGASWEALIVIDNIAYDLVESTRIVDGRGNDGYGYSSGPLTLPQAPTIAPPREEKSATSSTRDKAIAQVAESQTYQGCITNSGRTWCAISPGEKIRKGDTIFFSDFQNTVFRAR